MRGRRALPDDVSRGGDEEAGVPRRWAPAVAVAAVVAPLVAGLPLLELALADNQAPPAIQVPVRNALAVPAPTSVTVEPAEGWTVAPSGDRSAVLRSGAATFTVEVRGGVDCARSERLDVAWARTDDPAVPTAGHPLAAVLDGRVRSWTGPTTEGLLFTACEAGLALAVLARGPVGSLTGDGFGAVSAMIESIEMAEAP